MAQQSIASEPPVLPSVKSSINWTHTIGAAGAIVVFIVVQSLSIAGISAAGKGVLAILGAAVVLWITQPISIGFTSLLVILLPWVFGYIKPEIAFSGFSGTTFWLVIGVLGMGSCVAASPLSKRLTLLILSLIGKPTFKRVMMVAFIMMFVLGYFIPSSTAKAAVLFAIMLPVVLLFGVKPQSRIGSALVVSLATICYATQVLTPTAGPLTAMIYGVLMQEGVKVSFSQWALIAVVPVMLTFVGLYLFMVWHVKPEANEAIGGREKIQQDLKALPPMGKKEIWVLVVTIGIMAGWLAGLNTTIVALVGLCLYVLPGIGVMSFGDLMAKGIHWETMIMVGAMMAIGPILGAVGLTDTFVSAISMPFSFATTPLLFISAMVILCLMVYCSMVLIPAIPLVIPMIVKVAPLAGVSPILGSMMLLAFSPTFFIWASGPQFAFAMKDNVGSLKEWTITGGAFFVISIVVWTIWIFVAPALGLIPG